MHQVSNLFGLNFKLSSKVFNNDLSEMVQREGSISGNQNWHAGRYFAMDLLRQASSASFILQTLISLWLASFDQGRLYLSLFLAC